MPTPRRPVQISAAEIAQANAIARRADALTGYGGEVLGYQTPSNTILDVRMPVAFWACIIQQPPQPGSGSGGCSGDAGMSGSGSGCCGYKFDEVIDTVCDITGGLTWVTTPDLRDGTRAGLSLFEVNGATDVPLGTIVRAYLAPSGERYVFEKSLGTLGDGMYVSNVTCTGGQLVVTRRPFGSVDSGTFESGANSLNFSNSANSQYALFPLFIW